VKRFLAVALAALPVGLAVWALAQPAQPRALAAFVPPGALLYLEARDFASLVSDWNASPEKRLWLASDNYQVFSRSRLFWRLEQLQKEFAAAAGVPTDLPLVEALAGRESALALYDIGEMHFLYIGRLEAARGIESALWRASSKFESRASAGKPYFVRIDAARGREAAFAALDGWVLVSTREVLLAQALALVAGGRAPALRDEAWYQGAVRGGAAQGDLRMALNLPALARTPHFRGYWIQRNARELGEYSAGLVDLYRGLGEYREERKLVRAQSEAAPGGAGLGRLLSLAPADAGLVRAWTAPSVDEAVELVARKTLAPTIAVTPKGRVEQPAAEDDFDTRVDEAPPPNQEPELRAALLRKLFETAKIEAALVVESSRRDRDGLFVGNDAAVALLGAGDWNAEAVRAALGDAVGGLYTVSGLGLAWQQRNAAGESFHETAGLARLALAARGRVLVVATSAQALIPVLARLAAQPAPDGPVYFAEYRHGRELDNFVRMMRMIDRVSLPEEEQSPDAPREPMFFSENLGSLGRTLGRLNSVSVRVRDSGAAETQTVVYRLAR
jgi:hypothetical protein